MAELEELDALIIRNIGDIEAAIKRAATIENRLLSESADAMEAVRAAHDWDGGLDPEQKAALWIAPKSWRLGQSSRAGRTHFAFFDFGVVDGPEGNNDAGGIASLLGVSPTASFWVVACTINYLSSRQAKSLYTENVKTFDDLLLLGFQYNSKEQFFSVNVLLDQEYVAKAVLSDDFSDAMKPLASALKQIEVAFPLFDHLVSMGRQMVDNA